MAIGLKSAKIVMIEVETEEVEVVIAIVDWELHLLSQTGFHNFIAYLNLIRVI